VSVADRLLPKYALMVTSVELVTVEWLTVNLADVAPAGIVTVAGTVAASGFELLRVTITPPVGAGPDRVIVPVTSVALLP